MSAIVEHEPIHDLDALLARIRVGWQPDYLFFWGHKASRDGRVGKQCLSQWWPAPFAVDGVLYPTAEHYMMAEKARLFHDARAAERVLSTSRPDAAKRLGRQVEGFDEETWGKHRFDIVVRGNIAKFGQHAELAAFLLDTKDKVIVEASPTDRVWGIGLAEDDPAARSPERWRGLNLLGFALMKVRSGSVVIAR